MSAALKVLAGELQLVGGERREGPILHVATLTPPRQAVRDRQEDTLFLLVELTGPVSPHHYLGVREAAARAYWTSVGSVTAALRRAVAAANRHLLQVNLRTYPSQRCHGGITCVALHDGELFIAQAGPALAYAFHEGRLESFFTFGETAPPLGMASVAPVRLSHLPAAPGDTLLLISSSLAGVASDDAVARVLPAPDVEAVLDGLEQVGVGGDFAALVLRWVEARAAEERVAPVPPVPVRMERPRREREPGPGLVERLKARQREPRLPPPPREPGPTLAERLKLRQRTRAIGRVLVAMAAGLWRGLRTLFSRLLPGIEPEPHRRRRRPRSVPQENLAVAKALAAAIPVAVAAIVLLTYFSVGADTRYEPLLDQARAEIELARAAGDDVAAARPHWNAALEQLNAIVAARPDHAEATALRDEAQAALDRMDGILRVRPTLLWDSGTTAAGHRLAVYGSYLYLLDPAAGEVTMLMLNDRGDGVLEPMTLVRRGEEIGGQAVGELIDLAWAAAGGARATGGLLVLEGNGALLTHDPAWEGVKRSELGTPVPGTPVAMAAFEGRLYVLDTTADQIWRYLPDGETYPGEPEPYFSGPPSPSLTAMLDLAIDGNIYVLYEDGSIRKFLGGEEASFTLTVLAEPLDRPTALAVDPEGTAEVLYVADGGNERVVLFDPEGSFLAQLHSEEGAFSGLESLVVDEVAGRLYAVSAGRLYTFQLPPLP